MNLFDLRNADDYRLVATSWYPQRGRRCNIVRRAPWSERFVFAVGIGPLLVIVGSGDPAI